MGEEPLFKGCGDYGNLLPKQFEPLGEPFLQEGGLRERMTRMRLETRKEQGIYLP